MEKHNILGVDNKLMENILEENILEENILEGPLYLR